MDRTFTFIDDDNTRYEGDIAEVASHHVIPWEESGVFRPRGIRPAVRLARGYGYWAKGNTQPLKDAWYPFIGKGQRSSVSRSANQSDGLIITRHIPPGLDAPPIAAEIRPLEAVETKAPIDATNREAKILAGKYRGKLTLEELEERRASGDPIWQERPAATKGKYLQPPTPLVPYDWGHDHDDDYNVKPERRAQHVKKRHGGTDVVGWHPHTSKRKDPNKGQGKRLDMHPHAAELFEDASRVFFGIEGCLKADAILSKGEAVFSVPAVGLWGAPELPAFIDTYLTGKTVIIVPDADWNERWQVNLQAQLCRTFLKARDIAAFIAAPPVEKDAERDVTGKLKRNGVDDFLGSGGSIDDLVLIGREMPPAFNEWIAKIAPLDGRYANGLSRDASVLQVLSLCAGIRDEGKHPERHGEIRRHVNSILAVLRIDPDARVWSKDGVGRALEKLQELPGLTSPHAITIDGSLELSRGHRRGPWYDWSYDFEDAPLITIAEELCAVERDKIRLGDLDRAVPEQFIKTDTSIQKFKQLRAALKGNKCP